MHNKTSLVSNRFKCAGCRVNNGRAQASIGCTRDFAKALTVCALLAQCASYAARYYSDGICSTNFSVLALETKLCLNPLVKVSAGGVAHSVWLYTILKSVTLAKYIKLTLCFGLFRCVSKPTCAPFLLSKLERAISALLV
ncbi:MAG: hypothetical protein AAI946_00285 [Candidatus Hodgkinia cicadicola]